MKKPKPVFSTPIIYHQVIPKVRITRQGRYSPKAQRYLKSQEALGREFKRHHQGTPIDYPVWLSFTVNYIDNRVRDLDNITKAIMDSLQQGFVLKNDHWISGFRLCTRVKLANETRAWLSVRLEEAEPIY